VAQIRHISKAETDRVLLCARATFQKPVYMTLEGPWFDASMRCSSDRSELLQELREKEVGAFENESAVLLLPPGIRPDSLSRDSIKWHKFSVTTRVSTLEDLTPPGSRMLSKEEQNAIAKVILEEAVLPPLAPGFAEVAGDTGEMEVALLLDAHHLSPQRESVVALFGPLGASVRLVYGELVHGTYRILWDTPLVGGSNVTLSYEDVDADGIPEIVLRWTEAGGNVVYDAISVFNAKGEELTRQQECYPSPRAESAQFACAIWGTDIRFEKAPSGKYDILDVPSAATDPQDAERYTLVDGHYSLPIPILTAVKPTRVSRAMANGKITLHGRNFIRDSEVRFTQKPGVAADQNPGEVVVSAEFVSPTKLRARVSDVLGWQDSDWQVQIQNASGHSGTVVIHVAGVH
jgi:hypothetical protein